MCRSFTYVGIYFITLKHISALLNLSSSNGNTKPLDNKLMMFVNTFQRVSPLCSKGVKIKTYVNVLDILSDQDSW